MADSHTPRRRQLRGDLWAQIAGDDLYIYRAEPKIMIWPLLIPGRVQMSFPRCNILCEYVDNLPPAKIRNMPSHTAYIDAESVRGDLFISGLRPGVRFRPYGRPGSKKAGDFLTDRKYPQPLRAELPVVYDRSGIVWLAGIEIDHRVHITAQTRRIARLEIRECKD